MTKDGCYLLFPSVKIILCEVYYYYVQRLVCHEDSAQSETGMLALEFAITEAAKTLLLQKFSTNATFML